MMHIHSVTVISEPLSAFVRAGTPSTGVMGDPARTPFIASSARPWSLRPSRRCRNRISEHLAQLQFQSTQRFQRRLITTRQR